MRRGSPGSPAGWRRLDTERVRLAALGGRLAAGATATLAGRAGLLGRATARLDGRRLGDRIGRGADRLGDLGGRLAGGLALALERRRNRLGTLAQLLASLSYKDVLRRGFALVRDGDGRPLRSAAVAAGTALSIEFHDGRLDAVAAGSAHPARPSVPHPAAHPAADPVPTPTSPAAARRGRGRGRGPEDAPSGQGSLF
jgi:exodeoxyribonuclease VII large subunit